MIFLCFQVKCKLNNLTIFQAHHMYAILNIALLVEVCRITKSSGKLSHQPTYLPSHSPRCPVLNVYDTPNAVLLHGVVPKVVQARAVQRVAVVDQTSIG